MKISVYILTGIILLTIESSLLSFFPVEFFKPDLGMPFILYTTFFLGPLPGLITSIFISLFQEILSNAPHGSIIFTKLSIFLLATFMKSKLYIDSKYSFSYICGGLAVVESFLFLALSVLSKGEISNIINVIFYTIPNAIFTGFVSIFIFSLIESLNMKFLSRE
ncbi:MAG: hypothetical protein NT178_12070 [Proteobacteria bacterium]|nr:hypothetical protein [Pseudomonadota bacterium]